jgi:hypothetical protein
MCKFESIQNARTVYLIMAAQKQSKNTFVQDMDPSLAATIQDGGRSIEIQLSQVAVAECVVVTSTDSEVRITGNSSHLSAFDAATRAHNGSESADQVGSGMLIVRPEGVTLRLEEASFMLPLTGLKKVLEKLFPDRPISIVAG